MPALASVRGPAPGPRLGLAIVAAGLASVLRCVQLGRAGSTPSSFTTRCANWWRPGPAPPRGALPGGRRSVALRSSTSPRTGRIGELEESDSPTDILRHWRAHRRARVTPSVEKGWMLGNTFLRGDEADCEMRNLGPLAGGPPILWVFMVASPSHAVRLRAAHRAFQTVTDQMQSYTILDCTAGLVGGGRGPGAETSGAGMARSLGEFEASTVLPNYDIVVAVDDEAQDRVQALAAEALSAGALADPDAGKICLITDFLDVCGSWPEEALGPRPPYLGDSGLSMLQMHSDVPDTSGAAANDVLSLAVAGLERFLIAKYPEELKDCLHPYLTPKGI